MTRLIIWLPVSLIKIVPSVSYTPPQGEVNCAVLPTPSTLPAVDPPAKVREPKLRKGWAEVDGKKRTSSSTTRSLILLLCMGYLAGTHLSILLLCMGYLAGTHLCTAVILRSVLRVKATWQCHYCRPQKIKKFGVFQRGMPEYRSLLFQTSCNPMVAPRYLFVSHTPFLPYLAAFASFFAHELTSFGYAPIRGS